MHFLRYLCLIPAFALGSPLPWLVFQRLTQSFLKGALGRDVKVPVQLGVMSRCPDALYCERVFDDVLKEVGNKVDLSTIYIAKIDDSEPDFGVKCKHGSKECAGNVQQLCVHKYMSRSIWWNFVNCQNQAGVEDIGDPNLALKCSHKAGFDWKTSQVGECAGRDGSGKGMEGIRLLRQSVQLGHNLGVQKSCTILIDSKKVCVHDGGWKECEGGHGVNDFIHQINEEYDRLNKD